MKSIFLAFLALLTVSHASDKVRIFAGICSDKDWPHRYIIEERDGTTTVQVEQNIPNSDNWFSWGDSVKTVEATPKSIRFSFPWGVIGKALPVDCVIKFDKIADDGFDATLTIVSFDKDNTRKIRFTKIREDQLAPSITAKIKHKEAQQVVDGKPPEAPQPPR